MGGDKLSPEKMRVVEVVTNEPYISFSNTAYDQGEELYKIEQGMVWVKQVPFLEGFEAKWKQVMSEEVADKILIKNYFGGEVLLEYPVKK